jgi:universal stress protein E
MLERMMRILCATDMLPKSDAAVERGGLLADQLGADLTLLHVVEPGESERALEHTLQIAQGHMRSRGRLPLWRAIRAPNIAVRAGNPARVILDTLEHPKARLLILGPHRKRPLRDVLEGTIAEKVLAARKCPLLVVRDQARGPYRRVLLAVDLSGAAASAIRAAESLILTPEVDARIVHAHEPPYQAMPAYAGVDFDTVPRYIEGWTQHAARSVRDLLRCESASPARYEVVIADRPPVPAILRTVEHHQADLLVMGTRGGGRVHRALIGSVANRVLSGIACDTLIVPHGSVGASRSHSPHRNDRGGAQQPSAGDR